MESPVKPVAVMLHPTAEKVLALLEPHIERQGYELVSVDFRKGTRNSILRLLVDKLINETISLGSPGVDEVRWIRPVHPDEVLHGRFTILDSKVSQSKANLGIIRSRGELLNSSGEVVMSLLGTHFIGRRPNTSTGSNV